MYFEKAKGEGQGRCRLCTLRGKPSIQWMCFLYSIKGYGGLYCFDCVKEIIENPDLMKDPISRLTESKEG